MYHVMRMYATVQVPMNEIEIHGSLLKHRVTGGYTLRMQANYRHTPQLLAEELIEIAHGASIPVVQDAFSNFVKAVGGYRLTR